MSQRPIQRRKLRRRLVLGWSLVLPCIGTLGCSTDVHEQPSSSAGTGGTGSSAGGSPPTTGGSVATSSGGAGTGGGFAGTGGTAPGTGGIGSAGVNGTGGSISGSGGVATGGGLVGGTSGTGGKGGSAGTNSTGGGGGKGGSGGASSTGGAGAGGTVDYGATGPFADAKMFSNVGPNNAYTVFRPDTSLGRDGFKHPLVAWGNGATTTPAMYEQMLTLVASHGFVVIATNNTQPEENHLSAGLDWLVQQNASGTMAGKLDTSREATIGYSWGGGAAIDTARRPNVLCTASLHGMPPRRSGAFQDMHAPLFLTTSTGDTFVSASQYVTPNYNNSIVQTFYGTLNDASAAHAYPVEDNAAAATFCSGQGMFGDLGKCKGAEKERAPLVAWLSLWVYGDEKAKKFFYGDDCTLCATPWGTPQRKQWR